MLAIHKLIMIMAIVIALVSGLSALNPDNLIINDNPSQNDRPLVNVMGMVAGSDAPTVGLAGATIILEGEMVFTAVTDATGHFTIQGVNGPAVYQYTISHDGYNPATGSINLGSVNYNMNTIILSEIADPPTHVVAVANPNTTVTITWDIVTNPAGYRVWRLAPGQETTEQVWTMLTPNTIYTNTFTDTGWNHTDTIRWAVKAVYINNVHSAAAFSNTLSHDEVTVSGQVRGSDFPAGGLANATVALAGETDYSVVTDTQGMFSFPGVTGNAIYQYTVSHPAFLPVTGTLTVGGTDVIMTTIILQENHLPAHNVTAAMNASQTAVNLSWSAPNAALGEWVRYDTGENTSGIGTGGVADFDIASRWTAASLSDYANQSLFAVKFFPHASATVSYSIRVWTGGNATAPGTLVIDQPVSTYNESQFNTVYLATPVPLVQGQELWFGVRVNQTFGYPAGVDSGPAVDGLGNLICNQGTWTTLLAMTGFNYNWNLAGYIGYSAPTVTPQRATLAFNTEKTTITSTKNVTFAAVQSASPIYDNPPDRSLIGYKIWRLAEGMEQNEAVWTQLTPGYIVGTTYIDNSMPSTGIYLWAVKAVYTGNILSPPAFSNTIIGPNFGQLTGIVRDRNSQEPIANADIYLSTNVHIATTDDTGYYHFYFLSGTYDVLATAEGYADSTLTNIGILGGQTVNQDIFLRNLTANEDDTLTPGVLLSCYPNPFRDNLSIFYNLPKDDNVMLSVYNVKGQLVREMVKDRQSKGTHQLYWNGWDESNLPCASGVYFLRLRGASGSRIAKILYMK